MRYFRIFNLFAPVLFTLTSVGCLYGQKHHKRFESINVLHYKFDIKLSDITDEIEVKASIKIEFLKRIDSFYLDFAKKSGKEKGMTIQNIMENGNPITSIHNNNKLIFYTTITKPKEIREYEITYKGIPSDGLIISKNKFGDRTFFGDNWPDRGKNWLPVVDHPSDKATVEWIITAPSHYQSIGNGKLIERTNLGNQNNLTHWYMTNPIPVKVMVIGVAKFAVQNLHEINNVPISTWVYPQNKIIGFKDFSIAPSMVNFMVNKMGPYPFSKLANVQSTTYLLGMENAGNIFYDEDQITGEGKNERVIIHEIAHQWFGNSASELNWHHVWLSEGFASYFTNLYFEEKYEREKFGYILN